MNNNATTELTQYLKMGFHLGHKKNQWNPKMLTYIYKVERNYHIIDLKKTQSAILKTYSFVQKASKLKKEFLFVITRKSLAKLLENEAKPNNINYINHRWLGGTLTNWTSIQTRIERLQFLENLEKYDLFKNYPKKESSKLKKELERLQMYLGGVKNMKRIPDVVVLIDQQRELTAIKECRKLNIPIISLVDTNCDPDLITYPIPGNDDSIQAVKFLIRNLIKIITSNR